VFVCIPLGLLNEKSNSVFLDESKALPHCFGSRNMMCMEVQTVSTQLSFCIKNSMDLVCVLRLIVSLSLQSGPSYSPEISAFPLIFLSMDMQKIVHFSGGYAKPQPLYVGQSHTQSGHCRSSSQVQDILDVKIEIEFP